MGPDRRARMPVATWVSSHHRRGQYTSYCASLTVKYGRAALNTKTTPAMKTADNTIRVVRLVRPGEEAGIGESATTAMGAHSATPGPRRCGHGKWAATRG